MHTPADKLLSTSTSLKMPTVEDSKNSNISNGIIINKASNTENISTTKFLKVVANKDVPMVNNSVSILSTIKQ
jgi:hypothetical protein